MKTNLTDDAIDSSQIIGDIREIQLLSFKESPSENINQFITKRFVSGENATMGYFTCKKGAVIPMHQHVYEQYSIILQGSISVMVAGKEIIVKAGEVIVIPPYVPHEYTVLEDDTIDIDFFSPARRDWVQG
jgi:quercetin dioxygenase-like cupin family protein